MLNHAGMVMPSHISTFFSFPVLPRYTMCPHALIPNKPKNPKSRLSGVLDPDEREKLAQAMLDDVLKALAENCCMPVVVATELFDSEVVQITVADADLNQTLNEILPTTSRDLLIIMADLPLADESSLKRVISTEKDLAIVPGRGGGTNVIYIREPWRFRVNYYGASFAKHLQAARDANLSVEVIDSFRLHTDIDEEDDLVELLIHGTGKSRAYLEEIGFVLSEETGRVRVARKR